MKAIIAMILQNFSVHIDIELNDKLENVIIMKSINGYPVTIQPRNKSVV